MIKKTNLKVETRTRESKLMLAPVVKMVSLRDSDVVQMRPSKKISVIKEGFWRWEQVPAPVDPFFYISVNIPPE